MRRAWLRRVAPSRQAFSKMACGLHRGPVRRCSRRLNSHAIAHRTSRRGPLGFRLWLADLAARIRLSRMPTGAADRRASRAVRVQPRAPRHAGAAGTGAWARFGWRLPRGRVSDRGKAARRGDRLSARARAGDAGLSRNAALSDATRAAGAARDRARLHDRPRTRAVRRAARCRAAASSGAARAWAIRPEPRLRARDRAGAGIARPL